jgi:imidazolonepropionase-like amidohydrolase
VTSQGAYKLIKARYMIDGLADRPMDHGAVLIDGSRIAAVGRAQELSAPEGAPVEVFDYPAGTLMPGLIDVHCHFNYLGDGTHTDDVMSMSDDVLLMRSLMTARTHLEAGVTTARETGAKHDTSFSLREGMKLGVAQGPRLVLCGNPVTISGGHMWQMGGEADGPTGVRAAVRNLKKRGADWIKVPVTGGSTRSSVPYRPSFTQEELDALTGEAHKLGLRVGAHSRLTETIVMCLDAGVDMVIHGGFQERDQSWVFRPEVAERAARQGMSINTTLHIGRARVLMLQEMAERTGESPSFTYGEERFELEKEERDFETRMGQVRRLIDIGVKLIPGTDSGFGWFPFGGFAYELECLTLGGMSPVQAINAATRDASEAIDVSHIVGTLEQGKEADILVVDGNAGADIRALHNVRAVFQAGETVRGEASG